MKLSSRNQGGAGRASASVATRYRCPDASWRGTSGVLTRFAGPLCRPKTGVPKSQRVKKWLGWVLLALAVLLAWEGYRNSRTDPATEALALSSACPPSVCITMTDRPTLVRTDVIRRQYQFVSSEGPVTVTCRRRLYFSGGWQCTSQLGPLE